ncbi:MAG: hypothetical protein Q9218_005287 [Villophora microphyllina]
MDTSKSKRRPLTLVHDMMRDEKVAILAHVRARIDAGHTVAIQYIRPGNDTKRTTCAYKHCPSPSRECLPGTYRISLEAGDPKSVLSQSVTIEPKVSFGLIKTDTSTESHGQGKSNGVEWFCLRCFEKILRHDDNDMSVSSVSKHQQKEYLALGSIRASIIPEVRSGHMNVDLDLDSAHQAAFWRWCGAHTDRECQAGETRKSRRIVQGPEGENMDAVEMESLASIKISEATYTANIDLNFVRGKTLSQVFHELDQTIIPAEDNEDARTIREFGAAQTEMEKQEQAAQTTNDFSKAKAQVDQDFISKFDSLARTHDSGDPMDTS